jgi:site-specific DNA-methyltransferase (adenine-specific)
MTRTTRSPRNRTIVLSASDRKTLVPAVLGDSWEADTVYCGDAVELMKKLPSSVADLVIADPPYNIGKDFGNNRDRRADYPEWTRAWIGESARLLKPGGSIYVCSPWENGALIQMELDNHFVVRNRITWKRDKGRGARRNWKNNMEDVWFATKGDTYTFHVNKWKKKVIAPYRESGQPKDWVEEDGERYRMTHPSNIWTDLCVPFWSMPENTEHPTQKPEKLVSRILEASSNEGDLVFDPFMGSGTTAVCARELGRKYLGFELNPDYVRLAMKRLARTSS